MTAHLLFEYEESLRSDSLSLEARVSENDFFQEFFDIYLRELKDEVSIEHIYPQNPKGTASWKEFAKYTLKQKKTLKNSLGNLVVLSKSKNSSLQNKSFSDKCSGDLNLRGYTSGSYSEIEVSKNAVWTAESIKIRGIKILSFVEKRWKIKFGGDNAKLKILGLNDIL